jgi:drug/metabolite transporter (DMT)-like permease
MNRSILFALSAAALFGASTPLAKLLTGTVSPVLLGGLLYLGSGIGLCAIRFVRDRGWRSTGMTPAQWPWLLGAVLFGGILGPVALMYGLVHTSGASASMLLNLEAVLTALIAWIVFRENADRRVVLGMLAIVAGGVVLSWPTAHNAADHDLGAIAIALACACWAIDNNLTRKVSANDALFIASSKGLIAGAVNTAVALTYGAALPAVPTMAAILTVGLLGYGISLVLFVLALRGLGSARTGAYFSTAPFIGAVVSLTVLGESTDAAFWLAAALMALGVWLHLTEHHAHEHTHAPLTHQHHHTHDEHHQHAHAFDWDPRRAHAHVHIHASITHKHPHFPDVHHRHPH